MPTQKTYNSFIATVWEYYHQYGRHDLPWRHTTDPYAILVSEIMLQQTQVERVIPKYHHFLEKFPHPQALHCVSKQALLSLWQGLGYNRRALYLQQSATKAVTEYGGQFPADYSQLLTFPGIGPATAADLMAFAWNMAVPTIETNIRTVYIHHFFPEQGQVADVDMLRLVKVTLDYDNPRHWYWALMDYGAHLKKTGHDRNAQSKQYTRQSQFEGSNRQLRSRILKAILAHGSQTRSQLTGFLVSHYYPAKTPAKFDQLVTTNLNQMTKEGLLLFTQDTYSVESE